MLGERVEPYVERRAVPTFRIFYRPGRRWVVEDVDADFVERTYGTVTLWRWQLVVGRPRCVCALRAPEGDIAAVRCLCPSSAEQAGDGSADQDDA